MIVLGAMLACCSIFQNTGPNVPDWSAADNAGGSSENQHGFMLRAPPRDAGARD